MFDSTRRRAAQREAGRTLEAATRAHFALEPAVTVLATEVRCQTPGCPPVETVIAFWEPGGTRYRIKIFKPIAACDASDLPPAWLKPGLVDDGDAECC